jgi:hypothetical protein
VTLCEHATSHMRVLACNIRNIRLTKANAISHPGLVLRCVEDGLGNSVKRLKDWHCRAPKFLVDPLEGPSMRQCGRSWNLEHDPDFQH